ncbi:MAG: hypothetical protein CSA34_04515 [Desulfobulbus propionicus]|nr:MAG: hypothetical protein CSA34_04515 [Desulfobulbus propionicus]
MSDQEFTISQKEAAHYLNVSTKTISRYRKKGLPYKMMLNPVTGKQEVRFRRADLGRWNEGRQLLVDHGQEGRPSVVPVETKSVRETASPRESGGYLGQLLAVYREQVDLLREQLEDMRQQLARRDRQIDDLMRMFAGRQLEYKPGKSAEELSATTVLNMESPQELDARSSQKHFSREKLSRSIFKLRQRGKSYQEIVGALNHIKAAPPSGNEQWSIAEVQALLPSLVRGINENMFGREVR